MQATFLIVALGFISAALCAESGRFPSSAHPESNGVLTATASPLVTESRFVSQLHGASRPVLRRKSLMTTVLAAATSVAAIVAVAFLVLQCFKAIGEASRASSSLRRLASGDELELILTPDPDLYRSRTVLLFGRCFDCRCNAAMREVLPGGGASAAAATLGWTITLAFPYEAVCSMVC
ncbi:hypothetical protein Emag_006348 [Eimeria magna]